MNDPSLSVTKLLHHFPRWFYQVFAFWFNISSTEAVSQGCSVKKVFLEISRNSQENTCGRVSFLLKKRLWHRCFPLNFAEFLRTSFFTKQLRWLLVAVTKIINFSDALTSQIHGHYDMDTTTWTLWHGHYDMDIITWTLSHGHYDMDTMTWTLWQRLWIFESALFWLIISYS